jgi:uncharacterized protein (TIGR02246 family)
MSSRHLVPVVALLGVIAVGAGTALTHADDKEDRAKDEAAIKQLGKDWQDAWNKRDADALTGLLAKDVDFVTVLGPKGWMKGQEQFKEAHARMFKTLFTESEWTTKEVHVKFFRPDLAFARVLWTTKGDKVRHVKHGEPREGIFTWVVEKRDGRWRIIASQNTESMPALPGQ